jgi:fructuronate reductase
MSQPRLSNTTLGRLPPAVARPAYDRAAITPGIVHLGIGAFHRAHQAPVIDDLLAADPSWGIVGASLRSPATRDALTPQDGLYTLTVAGADGTAHRVIGCVTELLVVPADRERLLSRMADPRVRIVSLTVSEKGYCHDPATGRLAEDHPLVRADLAAPQAPSSVPGLIVEALARRRAEGLAPFAVMPCDNLPANGATVRRIVARFAMIRDHDLGRFVESEVAFPATMIDRITPATTDADRAAIAAATGLEDAWPVVTEPFSQWVVEDTFPAGRPDFAAAGVTVSDKVPAYERMKIRLLNGPHSTLAYLAVQMGRETVAEAMHDLHLVRFLAAMMRDEIEPTLRPDGLGDLSGYRHETMKRFANPALRHRTRQIAMDGSQKLPQRLLGSVRDRLSAGAAIDRLGLAVAAWMRWVVGVDEAGKPHDLNDPLSPKLAAIAAAAGRDADTLASGLLSVREIFGDDLSTDPRLKAAVTPALSSLFARGTARTLAEWPAG